MHIWRLILEPASSGFGVVEEENQGRCLLYYMWSRGNKLPQILGLLPLGNVLEDNAFRVGGAGDDPTGIS